MNLIYIFVLAAWVLVVFVTETQARNIPNAEALNAPSFRTKEMGADDQFVDSLWTVTFRIGSINPLETKK